MTKYFRNFKNLNLFCKKEFYHFDTGMTKLQNISDIVPLLDCG